MHVLYSVPYFISWACPCIAVYIKGVNCETVRAGKVFSGGLELYVQGSSYGSAGINSDGINSDFSSPFLCTSDQGYNIEGWIRKEEMSPLKQ